RTLDQKNVPWMRGLQFIEAERGLARLGRVPDVDRALLRPDEVQGRARPILPAKDGVGAVLLEVKGAWITAVVRVVPVAPTRSSSIGDLKPITEVSVRGEGLGIELDRKRRRRRITGAQRHRPLRLLETSDSVVSRVVA